MSFRSDAVKLDDLMRRVEEVTGKPQSDIEKLAIFLKHFHADSRPDYGTDESHLRGYVQVSLRNVPDRRDACYACHCGAGRVGG
jgi:hypothetical protein